jgi:hypothetical protein
VVDQYQINVDQILKLLPPGTSQIPQKHRSRTLKLILEHPIETLPCVGAPLRRHPWSKGTLRRRPA